VAAGIMLAPHVFAAGTAEFPTVRTAEKKRKFRSKAVDKLIADMKKNIGNKELAWMFENCFPNTLDTTVDFDMLGGKPDTYVITGDIDAMWLRDSSAQVWPYLPLCKEDKELQNMIKGLIARQAKCIIKDPYANAFYKNDDKLSEWHKDMTQMQRGIHERKWEVDSLCYPIRLAYGYWEATGDTTVFDEQWFMAMANVVKTFKEQQRFNGNGPYSFMRKSAINTDTGPMGGFGNPAKPNGLICSVFRPSDDATIFPYLIPANFFAMHALLQLTIIAGNVKNGLDVKEIDAMIKQISNGLAKHAKVKTEQYGEVYAYEVNGFGSFNLMDDANVPSLLSLEYLIPLMKDDKVWQNTRRYVLSADNPYYFKGKVGEGIGGPHVGADYIWPISIIMRGLTANDDKEIKACIQMLQITHAGKGFMHEAFHKDDANKFTRPWFAWANSLFGEFIWKVYRERPHLLKA
jgi:hypothetical protein